MSVYQGRHAAAKPRTAAAIAGLVLVAGAAFVLSYQGAHQIALHAGVSAELARLYPVILDAMLVMSCAAALALRTAGGWIRSYVWACLFLLLAALALGKAVSAMNISLPAQPTRAVVAVLPWALLLMGFGILLALLRDWRVTRVASAAAGPARLDDGGAAGTTPGAVGWTGTLGSGPAKLDTPRSVIDELMEPRTGLSPERAGTPVAGAVPGSLLSRSVNGLHAAMPAMSAKKVLSRGQAGALLIVAVMICFAAAAWPAGVLIGLIAVVTAAYLLVFLYNLVLFRAMLRGARLVSVPDEVASSVPDASLPRYTVLIAAYHEAGVIEETLRAMAALDYPRDRLEIKLLLEQDDIATIAAVQAARPGNEVDIVHVPTCLPRTKPKALNYGLGLSTGELVTVYDAEDRPEPLQLRRAAVAFGRGDRSMACLQARLYFYNDRQNLLTRWFAAEYNVWFAESLPALARLRAPVPLGGTSMHIRRDVLESIGAWDSYNVTEDADLGVRLHRMGFTTGVLDSETLEEANSDLINWVRQRSRWYKGYLQTWLVHMRSPARLWRETRGAGVAGLAAVVGGTPLLALVNPFFWLLTCLWALGDTSVQALFPAWLYYLAMLSIFGNLLPLYRTVLALRTSGHPELLGAVLLWPLYWIAMSTAALRAVGQLMIAPWFWEKTVHGLDEKREPLGD